MYVIIASKTFPENDTYFREKLLFMTIQAYFITVANFFVNTFYV